MKSLSQRINESFEINETAISITNDYMSYYNDAIALAVKPYLKQIQSIDSTSDDSSGEGHIEIIFTNGNELEIDVDMTNNNEMASDITVSIGLTYKDQSYKSLYNKTFRNHDLSSFAKQLLIVVDLTIKKHKQNIT